MEKDETLGMKYKVLLATVIILTTIGFAWVSVNVIVPTVEVAFKLPRIIEQMERFDSVCYENTATSTPIKNFLVMEKVNAYPCDDGGYRIYGTPLTK